jgi:imidazolonepropionase-like amidohydrolase/ABC-type multidrug transport system permease subunit
MKPYLAQIRSNLRLMKRDRAVLFFSYLFPLTFFFLFAQLFGGAKDPTAMAQVLSMVIVIGILGNGFFGAGMRTVQDREANVLRRFKVAPISPMPLLVAGLVSGVVSFLPTTILFFLLAEFVYHMPAPHNFLAVLLFICFAVVAFRTLGTIVAAVVNSANEAQILIQILYLPMLFLSGATFPVSIMPVWVQVAAGFLPATYLYSGMKSMLITDESIWANWAGIGAFVLTTAVGLFIASKLFRWEKEEKIAGKAKAWVLVVLLPFLVLGVYQGKTRQNIQKEKILAHLQSQNRSILFNNVRIFIGDGYVIQSGAVLIRNGKIDRVFQQPPADAKSLNAEIWDESGRTLMPGLIDMHVHLGAPGGIYKDVSKYSDPQAAVQRLAAYLYCGITAVRSTGDWLDSSLKLRAEVRSGEEFGAELFTYGPLFTAPGGHPTELLQNIPQQYRAEAAKQFVRLPNTPQEARQQVDVLKMAGVDGIKAVLESGSPGWGSFNRLTPDIYRAVISEAAAQGLPAATHTGNAADVDEAVSAGTNTIEHGSRSDLISNTTFAAMKQKAIAFDPTLSVHEAIAALVTGNLDLLNRSLLQRVVPADLLRDTRTALSHQKNSTRADAMKPMLGFVNQNLVNAYKAGVPLITGSDAGNMLVFHGPTIQHELALWVKAGIPTTVALQAATSTAAKYLRAEDRIGSIQKGRDATFLLLEGDPVQDITATERISDIFYKGEQVQRYKLVHQEE